VYKRIADITIRQGFRKDLGDIDNLAASLADIGLISPVILDQDGNLIAGRRRLAAAIQLGWAEIRCEEINLSSVMKGERDDNVKRKDFTPTEMNAIRLATEEYETAAAKARQLVGKGTGGSGGRGKKKNLPQSLGKVVPDGNVEKPKAPKSDKHANEAKAKIAQAVGTSDTTLNKIQVVMEAAVAEPEKYGDLPDEMDATGKIHGVFSKVKKGQRQDEIANIANTTEYNPQIQIYHASNMDMITDETVDLVLTDPPYNISRDRLIEFTDRKDMTNDFGEWDKFGHSQYIKQTRRWAKDFYRILRDGGSVYAFCAEQYISHFRESLIKAGFKFKNVLVWHVSNPKPKAAQTSWIASCDHILFAVKGDKHTFNWTVHNEMHNLIETPICMGSERYDHPTQKPEALLEKLILVSSNPGDLIADPFAGAGSVSAVAKRLNRSSIAIEENVDYINIISARLEAKVNG